jgi:tetratricopeptide (TPR) repeat protein
MIRTGDWEACGRYLSKALRVDPTLSEDLELFYELALGTQPMGNRGTVHRLDLKENAKRIASSLEQAFRSPAIELRPWRRRAYGTAYYALGLVAYNVGEFSDSRRFLLKAMRILPTLCLSRVVVVSLFKTLARGFGLRKLHRMHPA